MQDITFQILILIKRDRFLEYIRSARPKVPIVNFLSDSPVPKVYITLLT